MIKDINVDITLRNNKTGGYLRIPVIPKTITYQGGEAIATTVQILQLGDVDFTNGVALDEVTWSAFFPARYDEAYCKYSDLLQPKEYIDTLEAWKREGATLQLIIAATGINKPMYVKSIPWEYGGFEGDIYYNILLKEMKELRPIQIPTGTTTLKENANNTPAARAPVAETTKPKTYTVKPGDSLIFIAKKAGVSNWKDIYTKNQGTIGADPNKIYPGQVLTL